MESNNNLPEGVFTEPADNRIELSKVLEVALEARKKTRWCDTFWSVLNQAFGIETPKSRKTTFTFTVDPSDERLRAAIHYGTGDGAKTQDWDRYNLYRFFRHLNDYDTPLNITKTDVDDNVTDPNDGKYIDRDVFLQKAKQIRDDRGLEYKLFWGMMEKLGFEKPALNTRRITIELTPGKQGIPAELDLSNMTPQTLRAALEYLTYEGSVGSLDQLKGVVEELPAEKKEAKTVSA